MDMIVRQTESAEQPTAAITKWNAELAFRPVVEATADKAGLEYMRHLVKNLALSLGVDRAFVAEFAGNADRVRTIAYWAKNDWVDNIEFNLIGTPCEAVVQGNVCLHRDNVQQTFPDDVGLFNIGARSYLGVPLLGAHGETLGHLAAIDSRPMSEDPRGLAIFEVFANRARVEIERLHAEEVLTQVCDDLEVRLDSTSKDLIAARQHLDLAYEELKALLEINLSSMRHLRRDDLFAELARCVGPLLPTERFGIEIPTGPESLRVHVLALDQPSSPPVVEEFPSAGTACRWAQEQRKHYIAATREELRTRFPMTFTVMEREGMESLCAWPLIRTERSFGALFFMSTRHNAYQTVPVELMQRVASAIAVAVDNCFAYEEVAELRDRLAAENVYLMEEIQREHNFEEVVGQSPAIREVLALVETVAKTQATVLIMGETGTGKELIARAIHNKSPRRDHPLVKVNCSAISAGLVESELFGHVKGAFTGAAAARMGRFEVANGGTIFLDEVGELPLETQVKLLRVLQEREIERVGDNTPIKVDVRVIAATNRDLQREVAEGRFRADLYYRLNVFPLVVPPLRDRGDDVELLTHHFVERYAREFGKEIEAISRSSMARVRDYDWPGNVRELSNMIERAVVLARGPILDLNERHVSGMEPTISTPASTAAAVEADRTDLQTIDDVLRDHIVGTLERARWVIEGPDGAAKLLGTSPSTLRHRMSKLGIRRPA